MLFAVPPGPTRIPTTEMTTTLHQARLVSWFFFIIKRILLGRYLARLPTNNTEWTLCGCSPTEFVFVLIYVHLPESWVSKRISPKVLGDDQDDALAAAENPNSPWRFVAKEIDLFLGVFPANHGADYQRAIKR